MKQLEKKANAAWSAYPWHDEPEKFNRQTFKDGYKQGTVEALDEVVRAFPATKAFCRSLLDMKSE